jgi:hypothetical protein
MEHPLIGSLAELKDEELQTKISDLNSKLLQAHRMGNTQLINQVHMALETYRNHYQERQRQQNKDSGQDDKIDIS